MYMLIFHVCAYMHNCTQNNTEVHAKTYKWRTVIVLALREAAYSADLVSSACKNISTALADPRVEGKTEASTAIHILGNG